MKSKIIFPFIIFISLSGYCQNYKPTYQSNPNVDFTRFLSGVKYAYVGLTEKDVKTISDYPSGGNAKIILGVIAYLEDLGFSDVKWGTNANIRKDLPSVCDMVVVYPSWGFEDNTISNITLNFSACSGDVFRFVSNKDIWVTGYTNISTAIHNKCMDMYGYKKGTSAYKEIILPFEMTDWTEQKLKTHFLTSGSDAIEGIYESASGTSAMPKYKVGVVKTESGYTLVYFGGANNYNDWTEGEVKAKLTPTATSTLFKAEWKMGNKKANDNAYISFETGLMNLMIQGMDKTVYIKLFPTASDNVSSTTPIALSGSGFAISSDGIIVTNHHVVEGAVSVKIRGVNGDFSKTYKAKVLADDKNNDLAIIQIDDASFSTLGTIPYVIPNKSCDVGCSIFCLGYPLRATMGDEVKLTNGIISSKSGFQGDITSYQITAPIQPGNSGGPLFDDKGNLIGIINAKHLGAENVSYAIKVSYLLNLIDLLTSAPKLQSQSILNGKTLSEQVKLIKNYTYIIEVNQ